MFDNAENLNFQPIVLEISFMWIHIEIQSDTWSEHINYIHLSQGPIPIVYNLEFPVAPHIATPL